MAKLQQYSTGNQGFYKGYVDDPNNASMNHICYPSQNCLVDRFGDCTTRLGYSEDNIDLGEGSNPATGFYVSRFDLSFFAVDDKVYYAGSDNTPVDTGISFTSGTRSRFEEYAGNVFVGNKTDGWYMILVTRLNGAVSSGAATITTDADGGARANPFDAELTPGTKNIRIGGTNEQYASVTTAGVFTLSGTASQAYSDDTIAIVVYDLTSRYPKCSKILEWKESMHFIGITEDDATLSVDSTPATLGFTQFTTAAAIENIVKVAGGTSGTELVGKSGKITNAVQTRDYLYLFKENATYFIPVSSIDPTAGARIPQIISNNYGCVNEDCAADLGNGVIAFLTKEKRVIAIRISTDTGAAVVFPDESFDSAIRNDLQTLDDDQSTAMMHYHPATKRMYLQVNTSSGVMTFVYDNNIGAWQPPQTGKVFNGYYNKNDLLMATSKSNDSVFVIDESIRDNGFDFEAIMSSPSITYEDGRTLLKLKNMELTGEISNITEILVEHSVDDGTPSSKTINSDNLSFKSGGSIGTFPIGSATIGAGSSISLAKWEKRHAVYPRFGTTYQCKLSSINPFKWQSWRLTLGLPPNQPVTLS